MAKRKRAGGIVILLLAMVAGIAAWQLFGSNTSFPEERRFLYIRTGSSFASVMDQLRQGNFLRNPGTFEWVARRMGYDEKVKAGKYMVAKGSGIYELVRRLRAGRQTPVNLVINKLRTKEDLAKKIGDNFECDSACFISFLNSTDSLAPFDRDTSNVITAVIPNTYSFFWNTPAPKIFRKLYEEQEKFWTGERRQKATELGLTPSQVYTLASIVEEESNKEADKGKIASVYLNRLKTGMRLSADPTVKFAMRDFGLKRIYNKHLLFPSPYNTYLNAGLPPGPICTPSSKTIDAVLNAPATTYLYFVAKPELNGFSNFASNYQEHTRYARAYRLALDSLMLARRIDTVAK